MYHSLLTANDQFSLSCYTRLFELEWGPLVEVDQFPTVVKYQSLT
jgi:hypothetical protein